MAKAAQQTGRVSGQPKERDTTLAGGADKQATSADDASDNLAGFQSNQFETLRANWTSGPKMTLRCSK